MRPSFHLFFLKVLLPVNVAAEEARPVRRCPLSLFGARAPLLFHPSNAAGLVSRWAEDGGPGCLRSRLPDWKELRLAGLRLQTQRFSLFSGTRKRASPVAARANSARLLSLQFELVGSKRSGSLCPCFTAHRLCTCRRPCFYFDFCCFCRKRINVIFHFLEGAGAREPGVSARVGVTSNWAGDIPSKGAGVCCACDSLTACPKARCQGGDVSAFVRWPASHSGVNQSLCHPQNPCQLCIHTVCRVPPAGLEQDCMHVLVSPPCLPACTRRPRFALRQRNQRQLVSLGYKKRS